MTQYVLWDGNEDQFETFDSEEELEEYLEDANYDEDEVEELQVYEVSAEYQVNKTSGYELEEL